MSITTGHAPEPRRRASEGGWRKYFIPQRVVVLAFALIEAAILGWATGSVILRDVAR